MIGSVGFIAALGLASADVTFLAVVLFLATCLWIAQTMFREKRTFEELAAKHFSRGCFSPESAYSVFNNSRNEFENRALRTAGEENITCYADFDPFASLGISMDSWNLVVDTRKGREGASPVPFTCEEFDAFLQQGFSDAGIPNLQVSDRLFIHGSDVGRKAWAMKSRYTAPSRYVDQQTLQQIAKEDHLDCRLYKVH